MFEDGQRVGKTNVRDVQSVMDQSTSEQKESETIIFEPLVERTGR